MLVCRDVRTDDVPIKSAVCCVYLNSREYSVLDRIICLLCVYICHYIFPFYYLDTVCQQKICPNNKRKYIMTNIDTQETDYSVSVGPKLLFFVFCFFWLCFCWSSSCVFVCSMLPVSLDCPFLIVSSVFANVYFNISLNIVL
jgi:hypothetical protein